MDSLQESRTIARRSISSERLAGAARYRDEAQQSNVGRVWAAGVQMSREQIGSLALRRHRASRTPNSRRLPCAGALEGTCSATPAAPRVLCLSCTSAVLQATGLTQHSALFAASASWEHSVVSLSFIKLASSGPGTASFGLATSALPSPSGKRDGSAHEHAAAQIITTGAVESSSSVARAEGRNLQRLLQFLQTMTAS